VQEGEVQFYTEHDAGIFIKAGDKGIYNKQSREFTQVQADTNVVSYATKQFVFEESSLEDVVEQLNAIYDKKIKISENIKNCRVTVAFNNEDIEIIAEILAETLNLRIAATDTEITLEGEGCE
jgi:ferric-dicitrate binding protein FerR (iron transport regulator)